MYFLGWKLIFKKYSLLFLPPIQIKASQLVCIWVGCIKKPPYQHRFQRPLYFMVWFHEPTKKNWSCDVNDILIFKFFIWFSSFYEMVTYRHKVSENEFTKIFPVKITKTSILVGLQYRTLHTLLQYTVHLSTSLQK